MLRVEKKIILFSTCTSVWLFLYSFLTNIYHFIILPLLIVTCTISSIIISPSLHKLHTLPINFPQPPFCHHSTPLIIIWPSLHSNQSPFHHHHFVIISHSIIISPSLHSNQLPHHILIISSSLQSKISSILDHHSNQKFPPFITQTI